MISRSPFVKLYQMINCELKVIVNQFLKFKNCSYNPQIKCVHRKVVPVIRSNLYFILIILVLCSGNTLYSNAQKRYNYRMYLPN